MQSVFLSNFAKDNIAHLHFPSFVENWKRFSVLYHRQNQKKTGCAIFVFCCWYCKDADGIGCERSSFLKIFFTSLRLLFCAKQFAQFQHVLYHVPPDFKQRCGYSFWEFFLGFDVKVYASLFVLTERKQKKDDDEMMEGSCLSSPPPLPLSHFSPPSGVVC